MSIETMKLALEVLEVECRMYEATDPETGAPYNMIQAITSLRQAIEQAEKRPAPMSEPNRIVAYSAAEKLRSLGYQWDEKAAAWQAQKQEPRNIRERWNIELDGDDLLVCFNDHEKSEGCRYERYVLADTSPPQRQPLTPESVFQIADQHPVEGFDPDIMAFARAIEAAHGIKGEA